MQDLTISIILASYNGEKYIQEQLISLFSQTILPMEIIVSDDGSIDNTIQIVKEEFAKHPEVSCQLIFHNSMKVINNCVENTPMYKSAKNFEFAAQHSKGNYIFFCDQDDVWEKNKISKFLNAIKSYPKSGIIFSDYQRVDKNLIPLKIKINSKYLNQYKTPTCLPSNEFMIEEVKMSQALGMTICIRKDILQACIPFSNYTYHDYWCMLISTKISSVVYIPDKLTLYRTHSSNVTAGEGKKLTLNVLLNCIREHRQLTYFEYLSWIDFQSFEHDNSLNQFFEKHIDWFTSRLEIIDQKKAFKCIKYIIKNWKLYKLYSNKAFITSFNDFFSILIT